jgi:hypothetical protein
VENSTSLTTEFIPPLIKETENYALTTGHSVQGELMYMIVHKKYGVAEVQTSILASALVWCDRLEEWLKIARGVINNDTARQQLLGNVELQKEIH